LTEALSIAAAVAAFFLTVVVLPLLAYIVRAKDKQIAELQERQSKIKAELEAHDREGDQTFEALREKLHALELQATELRGEASVAREVKAQLGKVFERLDQLGQELAGIKGLLAGKKPSIPAMSAVRTPAPDRGR
jgi:chromosome segregation ATPase